MHLLVMARINPKWMLNTNGKKFRIGLILLEFDANYTS